MADGFDIHIEGVDALNKRLSAISEDMRRKGGRYALRRASNVIRKAVRDGAKRFDDPNTSNEIWRNAAVRWDRDRFRQTGNLGFRVGIRGGARTRQENEKNPGGDTFYWRFIEFGTQHAAAHPFMRPALSQNTEAATREFVNSYNKRLDKLLAQLRGNN